MNHAGLYTQKPPDKYLELIYPRPKPMRRLEEWQRQQHQDLSHLTDRELAIDRSRCWHRIYLEGPPDGDWLLERYARLSAEQSRRRQANAAVRQHRPAPVPSIIVRRGENEVAS